MTDSSEKLSRLQLWGGIDSTCNRVGDRCFDQLQITGHDTRLSDLDLFAGLGLDAIRYPVLWERTAPSGLDTASWSWPDERLSRLRELGIRPIVGLLHHGNGPEGMSLLDPRFPEALATYARAVAQRYPWVDAYTPVNEPLTTARFSGLYGLWHPHARDPRTFVRILLAQLRATVLAMDAIREVAPTAELIQTEDFGAIYSTPVMRYRAAHENERRWLTWDFLCGRVDDRHPLWHYLLDRGATAPELSWFLDHPCPPDVLGVDHYLSSDRFQDENVERYPGEGVSDDGRHRHIDILAPRARAEDVPGADDILTEIWSRYRLPVALTETHNGCTREEQMRWFAETWEGAQRARARDVDVRAVTAWSLLGVQGWDALATGEGRYETGVFDIRSPHPRPTAMVPLLRAAAAGASFDHPLLHVPGWWRRPIRFSSGVAVAENGHTRRVDPQERTMHVWPAARPLLLVGVDTVLGETAARLCDLRGIPYRSLTLMEAEAANRRSLETLLDGITPWTVINALRDDDPAVEPARSRRWNLTMPALLAEVCAARNVRLLTFSSDLVFSGTQTRPYVERDRVGPLSLPGRAQATAERRVLNLAPGALVVRSGPLFGSSRHGGSALSPLVHPTPRDPSLPTSNRTCSPTYMPDLINGSIDLLIDGESGIWHLANEGEITLEELATWVAERAGLPISPAEETLNAVIPGRDRMLPRYSALSSERGWILPPVDDAIARYVAECRDDAFSAASATLVAGGTS